MKIKKNLLFILMFLFILLTLVHAEETRYVVLTSTILVSNPEESGKDIIRWTEERGGKFIYFSQDNVIVRIPNNEAPELRKYLETVSEDILYISMEAHDLRQDILVAQSMLKSRQEIYEKSLSYLDKADFKSTLALEKEIVQILKEIDSLKGRLRKLNYDSQYAFAVIYFSFKERTLPEKIPSSFDWINTINFYDYIGGDFYYEY